MLTDDQVRELRAKHGWAKETIRAIEREVLAGTPVLQPVAWQWRRKGDPWSEKHTYPYQVYATTDDSEVRVLYAEATECQDGQLPDGPVCPSCGEPRGPSGVDGGSWVHLPARRSDDRHAG